MLELNARTLHLEHSECLIHKTKDGEKFYQFKKKFVIKAASQHNKKEMTMHGQALDILHAKKIDGKNHYRVVRRHEWEAMAEEIRKEMDKTKADDAKGENQ
ncbi:hypothetical protein [Phaeocystidibacter luteus]|uniref:Uncharacterized protein n=1 Tax=Phaeocystidibacter luteus TaxID=911197 RepID=A0A6N6RLZ1_9FLAO|nr:hypothetical protein [Phaeocystidibacter luteus]KAB2814568.1 hypothetical protein F8C67_02175 [Phaeocystidibacter luteus]